MRVACCYVLALGVVAALGGVATGASQPRNGPVAQCAKSQRFGTNAWWVCVAKHAERTRQPTDPGNGHSCQDPFVALGGNLGMDPTTDSHDLKVHGSYTPDVPGDGSKGFTHNFVWSVRRPGVVICAVTLFYARRVDRHLPTGRTRGSASIHIPAGDPRATQVSYVAVTARLAHR